MSLAAFGMIPGSVSADPTGTKVISGDVTIHKQGKHTEFRQSTGTAILTHESFNIRKDESVHFKQPTTRSLAVNRVVGKDMPTNIAGKLTATGNVWVINPSGVAISKGAEVNVNGLIATTADITNDDILKGNKTFTGAPDGSKIINEGTINGGKGSVVLVAPTVENNGTITTKGSDVALGAGSGFTVDMDGDGLTKFEVKPGKGVKVATDGTIKADGGAVYMSAESKDTVRSAIVSVGGKVEATRVDEKGGVVYIHAGNGKAEITGTVSAKQTKGRGGKIIATGEFVSVKKTARLDASGETDGGTVHVGGAYKGKNVLSPVLRAAAAPADAPLPTAKITVVERGAEINVSAGAHGNGGEAVVWADKTTVFFGAIEAKGGFLSGDGGLVEVSGKINLAFDGKVDTSAPFGDAGSLLLDPAIVNIVEGPAGTDDGELDPVGPPIDLEVLAADGGGATFEISDDAIAAALAVGDVTIEATDAINFTGALTFDAGGATTLTFTAGGQVDIAGTSVAMGNHPLVVTSTGERILVTTAISTTGANVTLTAREIDISGGGTSINVGAGTITLAKSGTGAVLVGGSESGGGMNEFDFSITNGELNDLTANTVVIDSNGQAITVDGQTVSSFTTFRLESDGGNISLDNIDTTNTLEITAGAGSIAFEGGGTSSLGAFTVNSSGAITQSRPVDVTGATNITTSDAVTLTNTSNDFGGAVSVDTSGGGGSAAVSLTDTDGLTLGAITATTLTTSSRDLSTTAAITATSISISNSDTDGFGVGVADDANETTFELDTADLGRLDAAPTTLITGSAGNVNGDFDIQALTFANNLTLSGSDLADINGSLNFGANTFTIAMDGFGTARITHDTGTVTAGAVDWTVVSDITQAGAAAIVASDGSFISTGGGNINLPGLNNFAPTTFNASGNNITVNDISAIGLGTITATGNLTVTAGGTITDDATGSISVAGTTSLLAESGGDHFDIQLDNAGAALHDFGGAISAEGEDILIRATDDFLIGTITPTDNSAGTVDTTINDGNNGDLTLGVVNGAHVIDAALAPPGDLVLEAGTTLTQAALATIAVSGTTSLTAGGAITLGETGNSFGTEISATGDGISLVGTSSMNLGAIASTGTLSVSATGAGNDITDLAAAATDGTGQISVSGTTSLTAADDIVIDQGQNNHVFGNTVTLSADALTFTAGAALTMGSVNATNAANASNVIGTNVGNLSLTGNVAIGATSDLFLFAPSAGGVINQTGGTITADRLRISSAATATLNQAGNDVNTLDTDGLFPTAISYTDIDDLILGAMTVASLTLSTGGAVTDSGAVSVTGATSITTSGDAVTLDFATHNFGGSVSVDTTDSDADAPANVTINDDVDGLALGAIRADSLTVTADGTITDTLGSAISVTGTTSILANDAAAEFSDIVLDNIGAGAHTFGGAVTATGEDIQLVTTGAFDIGVNVLTVNNDSAADAGTGNIAGATGSLNIRAGGTITQSVALAVPGALDVHSEDLTNAGEFSDIVLTTGTNSIGGVITAIGEDISLTNSAATGITLGNVSANAGDSAADNGTNTGDLSLTASAGLITDGVAATTVVAPGNTSLSATTTVTLDNTGNDFADAGGATEVDISGTALSIRDDADGINFGTVSGSSLELTTNNNVTQAGGAQGVVISGNTTINATGGDVTLNGGANDFSTLTGAADSYDIFALTDIFLNGLSATAVGATDITVTSDGSIRNVASATTSARRNLTLTANGSFVNTNTNGSFIADSDGDGTGAANLTAGLAVIAETGGRISGASVTINSRGISLVSTSVTSATNGAVDINLTDGLISLGGTVTAVTTSMASPDITIDSTTSAIGVGAGALIDAAGALAVTSASGAISANATSTLEGGTVTLSAGTSVTTGIVTSTTGNVTVTANGGAFDALGTTTAADDLFITASTNVNVNNVVADNMSLTATGGTITQDAGTTISVAGNTTVTAAAASNITLNNAGNDFGTVDGVGLNVSIVDTDDIALGVLTVNGNLTVSAEGTVTDVAGEAISVSGTTSILATDGAAGFSDIVLDNSAAGDVHTFTGLVTASGEDIQINTSGAFDVGSLTPNADGAADPGAGSLAGADGDLTVRAGGSITQSVALVVPGDASFRSEDFTTAGLYSDILLDTATNSITGMFSAVGEDISITNAGPAGITLGTITANDDAVADGTIANGDDGDFTVISTGGAVTDTTGLAISVAGTTSILADSGGGDQFDVVLDNVNTHDFSETDPLNVTGEDISIDDIDGILLGNVTATDNSAGTTDPTINVGNDGDLFVNAGGDVGQFAGTTILVPGLATLNSDGGGFTLDQAMNDFSSSSTAGGVTGTAASFTMVDTNDIGVSNLTANAAIAVGSTGTIDVDATGFAVVLAGTSARATGNVELTSTGNDAGAQGGASIVADTDASGAGDVILSAPTGIAGGLPGSVINGASVSITGVSVIGSDITSSVGNVSLTATGGSVLVGANATTSINAQTSLDVLAATSVILNNVSAPTAGITATTGSIAQITGTTWNIPGVSTFTAGTTVTLPEANNDFGTVNASGTAITLYDTDAIVLDAVTSSGILSVTAEGTIDDATGSISVAGVTSLLATDGGAGFSDIVLDNGLHDFGTDGGDADATTEVDATGASITLTDVDGIKLGAVTANGALTVTATGSITDTDLEAISVTGATSLSATDGANELFDIRLDGTDADATDRPHEFGSVTFLSEDFSIVDASAITVNGTATRDSTAVPPGTSDPTLPGDGGVIVDAAGNIVVGTVAAGGDALLTTDAALSVTDLNAGGGFTGTSTGNMTLAAVTTGGDVIVDSGGTLDLTMIMSGGNTVANATGRTRIGVLNSTGGFISLTTGDYFSIIPGNPVPLTADGDVYLRAAAGGFIRDGAAAAPGDPQSALNEIPEELTFRSATGLIEFDFNVGFQVIDAATGSATPSLTFEAPQSAIRINDGWFAIGTGPFLTEIQDPAFDPLNATSAPGDTNLLLATGPGGAGTTAFGLISEGTVEIRLQNTRVGGGAQDGDGVRIDGPTFLGGFFSGISVFGTFDGLSAGLAAINGFQFIPSGVFESTFRPPFAVFDPNPENTANGCVIGAISSCTPLGSVVPFLEFDDGRLLSIKFVDPTEDEDDPFSNRGDEEEWE